MTLATTRLTHLTQLLNCAERLICLLSVFGHRFYVWTALAFSHRAVDHPTFWRRAANQREVSLGYGAGAKRLLECPGMF